MKFKWIMETLSRPAGKLMAGSLGGYAILLALAPLLTRLYSPETFGQFSVFGSFVAVASVCVSFSLELGILSARRRSEALHYARTASVAIVLTSGIFLALLAVFLVAGVDVQLPGWAAALAIVACATAGLTSVATNLSIYAGDSARAGRAVFAGLSARSLGQAALGYFYGGLAGLVLGEVLGRLFALSVSLNHRFGMPLRSTFDGSRPRRLDGRAIRPYALYITPAAAIDVALVWLPAPLFALLFGPVAGGLVAMMQRLASVPITVANQSIGQVFHRRAALMLGTDNRRLVTFILAYFAFFFLLAAVAVIIMFFFGETLFGFLLGEAWGKMYLAAIAMAPLYLFQFVSILTNRIILVSGRANLRLATSSAQLAVLVAATFASSMTGASWEMALFWVASSLALTQCASILYVLHMLVKKAPHQT